jgi:hypothetical protein
MTQHALSLDEVQAGRPLTFTPARLAVLIPYGVALWLFAFSVIHFSAPQSWVGAMGVFGYAVTIPITMVINWLHLKLARLPKREIVYAVAVTLAVATTIDGIVMAFFPGVYGVDLATLQKAGAFIIWAGAVAFWLAFWTRLSADKDAAKAERGAAI